MISPELTAAVSAAIGKPVKVQWVDMPHSEGRAHVDAKSWIVSLNPILQRDEVRAAAVLLHEVAHLKLGHIMSPAKFAAVALPNEDTLHGSVEDGGTERHLRRELDVWAQAAAWAVAIGRDDVAQHCKQRSKADFLNYVKLQLIDIDARLRRLESGQ